MIRGQACCFYMKNFVYSAGLFPPLFCAILSSLMQAVFCPFCHSCRKASHFSEIPVRNAYPMMNAASWFLIQQQKERCVCCRVFYKADRIKKFGKNKLSPF